MESVGIQAWGQNIRTGLRTCRDEEASYAKDLTGPQCHMCPPSEQTGSHVTVDLQLMETGAPSHSKLARLLRVSAARPGMDAAPVPPMRYN